MRTERMTIIGMNCGGCTSNITNVLEAVAGVRDVEVTLSTGEATVQYDEGRTTSEQLHSAVHSAGYGVDGTHPPAGHRKKDSCCS